SYLRICKEQLQEPAILSILKTNGHPYGVTICFMADYAFSAAFFLPPLCSFLDSVSIQHTNPSDVLRTVTFLSIPFITFLTRDFIEENRFMGSNAICRDSSSVRFVNLSTICGSRFTELVSFSPSVLGITEKFLT